MRNAEAALEMAQARAAAANKRLEVLFRITSLWLAHESRASQRLEVR